MWRHPAGVSQTNIRWLYSVWSTKWFLKFSENVEHASLVSEIHYVALRAPRNPLQPTFTACTERGHKMAIQTKAVSIIFTPARILHYSGVTKEALYFTSWIVNVWKYSSNRRGKTKQTFPQVQKEIPLPSLQNQRQCLNHTETFIYACMFFSI